MSGLGLYRVLVAVGAVAWVGGGGAVLCAQEAPASLREYVGQYREASDPDAVTAVYLDGGALYEETERSQRQRLTPDGVDRFRLERAPTHLRFDRDTAGAVTGFAMVSDRNQRVLVEKLRFSAEGTRLSHYRGYMRREQMIAMRDGVRLHTVILEPVGWDVRVGGEALPILLSRTPYGVSDATSESVNAARPEMAASGYVFVYQDIRGRPESEGKFVMNRPVVHGVTGGPEVGTQVSDARPGAPGVSVDESTDAYDTVEWLVRNVRGNNGRVGVVGVSYDGFLAMMAGIDRHPAVKAVSPQAPMTDVWMGDDFFHNGAFRQSYGLDYVPFLEGADQAAGVKAEPDAYDFFLRHVNFAAAAAAVKMTDLPTARAFLTQPAYTAFWQAMAVERHLEGADVPVLEVGGWWDQEDMWGTQAEYAGLKAHDTARQVSMVLGPWNHGGWELAGRRLGSKFGEVDFGEATGDEFRKRTELPFFELYLKDRKGFVAGKVDSFRTGVNQWEQYESWPPAAKAQPLYLEAGGVASFAGPGDGVAAAYVADPASPVPYRHRPIQTTYGSGSEWYTWLVEDQRFVSGRKDLANFSTGVLDRDVTVTGEVVADLFAATTGSDADWVVKLIDVYPEDAAAAPSGKPLAGYELMVADEIFRGRYVKSFERAEALTPGKVEEFRWSLHGVDHTFLKGHRMMVEVQSSWFPLYDRNPQTFVENVMTAPASSYRAETVTVYGSAKYPSRVELPVMGE